MLDENGFLQTKANKINKPLNSIIREVNANIEFMTDEELAVIPAGSIFFVDVECYINFFYVAFKCQLNGKFVAFENSPACSLNKAKLNWMLWRFCLVTFYGNNYDMPMIKLATQKADCELLKYASDFIIVGKNRPFDFEREFKVKIPKLNHIDLIEIAPLQGSLKLYAGRLHCERMQDLPFKPDHILTEQDADVIRPYCCNDLANTELLFNELAPEIKLRIEMSEEYNIDLRSKSDAQIAEAVINSELRKVLGYYPKKPTLSQGTTLRYKVPEFIEYKTEQLKNILNIIENSVFELDGNGSPIMPKAIEKLNVCIGATTYNLGMGGLHSQEHEIAHYATDEIILEDDDVESFYPRIILNQKLFPDHLGEAFLIVYEKIVNTRVHAKAMAASCKKAGDKIAAKAWKKIADSLKIVINGSFGKLGNKWSTLYAPQLMLQVTITGQLVLLMLIEALNLANINVVSGNTDGIVSKFHKSRKDEVKAIIKLWENKTNFKTEETRYSSIFNRDVNNYIAVKLEGGDPGARFFDEKLGCKTKGTFSERGSALNSILSKNPEHLICSDAVINFIKNNVPVEDTITNCKDVRRFVSVRNVKGGGEKNGVYLGKVVRWYYAKNEAGCINYVGSGKKVAKTDNAKPVMDLPKNLPDDINYDWYIKKATEMLYDCGRFVHAKTLNLF